MGTRTEFAVLLADLLVEEPAGRREVRSPIVTQPFFWFEQHVVRPAAVTPEKTPHQALRRPSVPPASGAARVLSSAQQQALQTLVTLGAHISADFSSAELRRVFRNLALRYHPDRHTSRTEAEQAYLATLFGQACTAYEQLKTAARPALH